MTAAEGPAAAERAVADLAVVDLVAEEKAKAAEALETAEVAIFPCKQVSTCTLLTKPSEQLMM